MTEIKVTRTDGSSITFVLTGTLEQFQKCITEFQTVFDDRHLKCLFDALFKIIDKIFLIDEKANYDELKEMKLDCKKEYFDEIIGKISTETRDVDAMQVNNFIAFGTCYLVSNPSPQSFFATLIHELVHTTEQYVTNYSCVYDKLNEENRKLFNMNVERILETVKNEKEKGNLYFKEINIEAAQIFEHERLTYCVQAYVSALLSGSPTINDILPSLENIIALCAKVIS